MKKITLCFALLLFATRALAASGAVDLDFAFSQLKGNGPAPFANALYQDRDHAQRLVSRLDPLIQGAGQFNGYEIISQRNLAKKIERVVLVLYFDKAPIYMRIDLYETTQGKICLPAIVSKEAADVLPADFISAAGK